MTQPRITFVTPFRSITAALERTIASVLDQGYAQTNHVLVHAGRTADRQLLGNLIDARSTRIIHSPGVTMLAAIHAGISSVRTGYICVLNPGDVLLPGTIERVADHLTKQPHTTWLTGRCMWIDVAGRSRGSCTMPTQPTLEAMLCETGRGYALASTFLHIDLFNRCGRFDADLNEQFSLDLHCRLLAAGYQPTMIQGTIAAACLDPIRNRMQWILRMQERCEVIRRHAPVLPGLRRKAVESWCDREESQLSREMSRVPVTVRMQELLRRIENQGWVSDEQEDRKLLVTPQTARRTKTNTMPFSLAA